MSIDVVFLLVVGQMHHQNLEAEHREKAPEFLFRLSLGKFYELIKR